MYTLNVIIYTNGTFEEEQALSVDGEIVLQGDYYHDQIDTLINGFLEGLSYLKTDFDKYSFTIMPDDEMFSLIEFHNNTEEEC